MKHALILCFLTIFFSARGQERSIMSFIAILLEKDTIGLIDPLRFEINLINDGAAPREIYPLTFYAGELLFGDIDIEIKEIKDSTWVKINNCLNSRHLEYNAHGKIQVTLMPGNKTKSDIFSCALPPLKAGTYEIRAVYKNFDRKKMEKSLFLILLYYLLLIIVETIKMFMIFYKIFPTLRLFMTPYIINQLIQHLYTWLKELFKNIQNLNLRLMPDFIYVRHITICRKNLL